MVLDHPDTDLVSEQVDGTLLLKVPIESLRIVLTPEQGQCPHAGELVWHVSGEEFAYVVHPTKE